MPTARDPPYVRDRGPGHDGHGGDARPARAARARWRWETAPASWRRRDRCRAIRRCGSRCCAATASSSGSSARGVRPVRVRAAGRPRNAPQAPGSSPPARARGSRRRLRQARSDRRDTRSTSCPPEVCDELAGLQNQRARRRESPSGRCSRRSSAPPSTASSPSSTGSRSLRRRSARHTAPRLHTGEAVVVKVQRPGIQDVMERDLAALGAARRRRAAAYRVRAGNRSGEMLAQFADSLRAELDFRREATR